MVVGEISQERDLVIIGGGPGGYSAAIRGAQLGLSVTLIEEANMGGICLNKGCIPSKVFTHAAAKRSDISHLHDLGIGNGNDTFNLDKLHSYKEKVINVLRSGVESLCKANEIEIIRGKASFIGADRIGVEKGHQFDIYVFKQAIIATGSTPSMPTGMEKGQRVLLSHEIFEMEVVPEHLIVIGHDYIAFEVASSYAALGSKVSILLDSQSGYPYDESINKELNRLFKKRKITVKNEVEVLSTSEDADGISVTFRTNKDIEENLQGSHLFTTGIRKPNVESLGLNRIGIEQTVDGFIHVDGNMQTTLPTVYAIGDVTEGPLLAVKAIKQGKAAVESIAGQKQEVDLTFLPVIVHTVPPIASVGLTEQQTRELEMEVRVSQFALGGNGYGSITGKKDGFIKVISDKNTEIITGIHMIGEGAIEMSGSFVQLLEMAAKEEDIKFPTYAHPGFNEGLLEAVEGLIGQAIHSVPSKSKKKDLITS